MPGAASGAPAAGEGLRLGDILRTAAAPHRWGGKAALIWTGPAPSGAPPAGPRDGPARPLAQRFTYAELNALSNRAAHVLQSQGVAPGDRVAVLARNCPEYVWLYFALAKLGAILVPVNFWYRQTEIAYTLRQSGSTTFLFDRRFAEQAREALAGAGDVPRVLTWGQGELNLPRGDSRASARSAGPSDSHRGTTVGSGEADFLDLCGAAPETEPEPDAPATPETPHIILYTSGTTGSPKGAVFSQRAHVLHALAWAMMTGQHAGDVGLLVYPLFHTGGPDCVLLPHFLVGGTVVLHDGADPRAMLHSIATHRATNVFCVPTVWRRLLAVMDEEDHDVASVRRCLGSSDTLPPDLLDGILRRFDAEVYVTYGLTEAGCILTYSRLTREDRSGIATVGRPHPLVEVVVGAGAGEVGEVLARGPTTMDGYWALPEQTAAALDGGWLHSGDLGRFDPEGRLVLSGRAKDMIVTGGEKVYPLEVERLLRSLPGVADAALVGVPDPEWGESVLACVVRDGGAAGAALTGDAIREYVRPRLAGYKCPRFVEFVEALPVTRATNKVQKGRLRERFRDLAAQRSERDDGEPGRAGRRDA